ARVWGGGGGGRGGAAAGGRGGSEARGARPRGDFPPAAHRSARPGSAHEHPGPGPGRGSGPLARRALRRRAHEETRMTPSGNRQVILAARPVGLPKSSDFKIETAPVPEPAAGQGLVRNLWMCGDPYMRGRLGDRKSYAPSFQVGEPMEGRAVGHVVKSNHPQVKEGAAVSSMLGWREYFVAPAESVNLLDPSFPLSAYLGVLGIPGFTG